MITPPVPHWIRNAVIPRGDRDLIVTVAASLGEFAPPIIALDGT